MAIKFHNYLLDQLQENAQPQAPFLILPESGATLTYQEFFIQTEQMAAVLARIGVTPGVRVAAQIPKTPQALMLYMACVMAGAVFLPLNMAYQPTEITYFLENAEPYLFICTPEKQEILTSIATKIGIKEVWILADKPELASEKNLLIQAQIEAASFTPVKRGPDDLAALLYSSGTTGRPKGVMLTHHALASNSKILCTLWGFTATDRLLHVLPIFHTHGLFVATNVTLIAGGALIFLSHFNLDTVFTALPQATVMMGVPTFYTRMLGDMRFDRQAVAHMRLFISGSAPLRSEDHAAFAAQTGQVILERYGMTETNINSSNPLTGERRAGSIGLALPGVEMRVVDPENRAAVPNETVGEIAVRGPNLFAGYWRMPDETATAFRPDGFFLTGDLGIKSADGYFRLVGRARDLIISGGFNVYPKEIETVLDRLPGVIESAVIGVPHPDWGEAVVAVLVFARDTIPDDAALNTALSLHLADFKRPKHFIYVENLPRNAMGKVQKNTLRESYTTLYT